MEGKFLCWQLGEQKIKFWHDVDSGFDQSKVSGILRFESNLAYAAYIILSII
ncbi:MAG: DUF2203 family protein [Deltaproteobacteria bacterium]|nr:DUF2203 family protein [Deltaproteobacteria bacterium]